MDGVRIISSTNQELLQEVPLVCQEIFKIASMAPGALLLEAHREYEVGCSLSHWRTKPVSASFSPDAYVLFHFCVEVESEGWWVPERDQRAKHAWRSGFPMHRGSRTRIRPKYAEIPDEGEKPIAFVQMYSAKASNYWLRFILLTLMKFQSQNTPLHTITHPACNTTDTTDVHIRWYVLFISTI